MRTSLFDSQQHFPLSKVCTNSALDPDIKILLACRFTSNLWLLNLWCCMFRNSSHASVVLLLLLHQNLPSLRLASSRKPCLSDCYFSDYLVRRAALRSRNHVHEHLLSLSGHRLPCVHETPHTVLWALKPLFSLTSRIVMWLALAWWRHWKLL